VLKKRGKLYLALNAEQLDEVSDVLSPNGSNRKKVIPRKIAIINAKQ